MDFKKIYYSVLSYIEIITTRLQGKGYGSSTVIQEVAVMSSLLNTLPVLALDIGGNKGDYAQALLMKYPKLEIYIFEPSSENYQILTSRYNKTSNIEILKNAVSDKTEEVVLYFDTPGSGCASLSKRRLDHFNINFNQEEKVQSIRLDDFWENNLGKREIDIIKMDIEGFEMSALLGLDRAIKHTKAIQFEFGGCNLDTRTNFQDFWYFFVNNNFDIYRITPTGFLKLNSYSERDEYYLATNYIALNRNI